VVHPLEVTIGEARGCDLVLLDCCGRLDDFVYSKLPVGENYCSNLELLE